MPWWERLNRRLLPWIGPPPLGPGPGGEPPERAGVARCPLCGVEMSRHEVVRTADWTTPTRLHCPA